MSHDLIQKRVMVSHTILENLVTNRNEGPIDFTATAADIKFAFAPGVPIDILRFGVIAKTAFSGTSGVVKLQKTAVLTDLSAAVDIATLTLGTAIAANKGVYRDVVTAVAQATGLDGSLVNVKPTGPGQINPGEAALLTLSTVQGTAGTGWVFIEYVELPFVGTRIANMTKKTS